MPALDERQTALVDLGNALRLTGYSFITPTPQTHRLVNRRPENLEAQTLRDVFGWSRPFRRSKVPERIFDLGYQAQVLVRDDTDGERWRSLVRYSTLATPTGEMLFVHSSFPTDSKDSVFFGPDSYRFAAFVLAAVEGAKRLVDVGCGSGVGGLVLAARAEEVILADVNPQALRFAQINAALMGIAQANSGTIHTTTSDVLNGIDGDIDLVIANPPYLVDVSHRLYRDGGGAWGTDLAARIVEESLGRMVSGGRLVLYTGTPIVDGRNVLGDQLQSTLNDLATSWTWQEIDPDVFGEELARTPYCYADRLAVVALTTTARGRDTRAIPSPSNASRPFV